MLMLAIIAAGPLAAQEGAEGAIRVEEGDHAMRASVIRASDLGAEVAEQHGFPADDDHAILNVTVYERDMPVEADIVVAVDNLIGQRRTVEVRATRANGYVSYAAVIDIEESRRLGFEIEAEPIGSGVTLEIEFEQEFLPR